MKSKGIIAIAAVCIAIVAVLVVWGATRPGPSKGGTTVSRPVAPQAAKPVLPVGPPATEPAADGRLSSWSQ